MGEEGVRRALPVKKLVLKERPIARGTAGLMGLRRAVLSGEPGYPTAENDKSVNVAVLGNSTACTVSCTSMKVAAKELQVGEIAVSLSEDESEEETKEVSGLNRNELGAR